MAERTNLSNYEEDITDENVDETEQIREQIEETRQEMGETIQAIEEKLSLNNISEQVSEQISEKASELFESAKVEVYEATLGKVGKIMKNVNKEIKRSGILEKAVENPLPLFLIALGTGLLVFKGKRSRSGQNNGNRRKNLSAAAASETSLVKDTRNKIGNAATSVYQSAEGAASSVYETVGGVAGSALERVENLGSQARDSYDYYISENPLAVGAIAVAAGALVGLAIPSTSYENQLMGETRENLISKAQDKAHETIEQVRKVAGDTVSAVREEVIEKVQEAAGNQAETSNTKARNQGQA
jgi:hypothetical protein